MGRRKFTAKLKHWPHEDKDGVRHVYPLQSAKTTQVAQKDRIHFALNPQAQAFIRQYILGEFDGVPLSEGVNLNDITHVLVRRLNQNQQARIALTREMADTYFAKYGKPE